MEAPLRSVQRQHPKEDGDEEEEEEEAEEEEEDPRPPPATSPSQHSANPLETRNNTSSIRFLISNAAAGSIIGKGGATINEFQSQSGARIQLSRNHEYFPGTTDRIIALSGTIKDVLTAFHLILSKILNEAQTENRNDMKSNLVRLVVPNSACGAIIGKGGATIKSYIESSNASIKLSPLEHLTPGLNDRIVSIMGSLDQQLRAVALILRKLVEDPNYNQYTFALVSYTGSPASILGRQGHPGGSTFMPMGYTNGATSNHQGSMPPLVTVQSSPLQLSVPAVATGPMTTSVSLAVPDEHVGAIVGRGGKIITEIQQSSGVRIKISDRGDFMDGTTNRKVTITGTAECVRIAQQLVTKKVQQSVALNYEQLVTKKVQQSVALNYEK